MVNTEQQHASETLVGEAIRQGQKILITGATGWFGRTATDLAQRCRAEVLLVSRQESSIDLGRGRAPISTWSESLISNFQPEIVIDTAFITKEKVKETGIDSYIESNRALMSQSFQLAKLPSVETYVGFSSGAAVTANRDHGLFNDPYGFLKNEFESEIQQLSKSSHANIVLIRPWSVAGKFLVKPSIFAFSNLIMQARSRVIHLDSSGEVWRRYCAIDDLLIAGLILGKQEKFNLVESGGELIEIEQLANRICQVLGINAEITRDMDGVTQPNNYFSNGKSWERVTGLVGLKPKGLEEMIREVDEWLLTANY